MRHNRQIRWQVERSVTQSALNLNCYVFFYLEIDMPAIVIHYANKELMDLKFLKDKGGCNLIFEDSFHAEVWILKNTEEVDNFYKIVEI